MSFLKSIVQSVESNIDTLIGIEDGGDPVSFHDPSPEREAPQQPVIKPTVHAPAPIDRGFHAGPRTTNRSNSTSNFSPKPPKADVSDLALRMLADDKTTATSTITATSSSPPRTPPPSRSQRQVSKHGFYRFSHEKLVRTLGRRRRFQWPQRQTLLLCRSCEKKFVKNNRKSTLFWRK